MGYLNQFPSTNFYDQDLGFLVKAYKELLANQSSLEERIKVLESIYTKVTEEVKLVAKETTLEQLHEWLLDGTLQSMLDNEYVVCIGDSYLKGNSGSEIVKGWGEYLCGYFNLIDGTNFFKFAQTGSGFYMNRGTSEQRFIDILKDNESKIDKSKVTKMIIGGGFNDSTAPYDDLNSYISEFVKYVNANYPNATIYIAFLGWDTRQGSTAYTNRSNLSLNTLYAYNNAVRMGHKVHTIICNDVLKQSYYMSTDGYHPTTLGYQEIAISIYNSIYGTYRYNSLSQTENLRYGIESKTYPGTAHSMIKNNSIIYRIDNCSITLDEPITVKRNQFPNFIVNTQNSSNTGSVPISLILVDTSKKQYRVTATLVSDSNNTSLTIPNEYENISQIVIPSQFITADISQTLLLEVKE